MDSVLPSPCGRLGKLSNVSEALYEIAVGTKNFYGAGQIIGATTTAIEDTITADDEERRKLTEGEKQRRRLLAVDPIVEAKQELRANLLSQLWDTFRLTPVTEEDMASIIFRLVGLVDTEEEIDEATGVGCIALLEACLRSSFGADIGMSSSGTAFTAEVLSSLFQVPSLFNMSDENSLHYAANATQILRSVSTVQLRNGFPRCRKWPIPWTCSRRTRNSCQRPRAA